MGEGALPSRLGGSRPPSVRPPRSTQPSGAFAPGQRDAPQLRQPSPAQPGGREAAAEPDPCRERAPSAAPEGPPPRRVWAASWPPSPAPSPPRPGAAAGGGAGLTAASLGGAEAWERPPGSRCLAPRPRWGFEASAAHLLGPRDPAPRPRPPSLPAPPRPAPPREWAVPRPRPPTLTLSLLHRLCAGSRPLPGAADAQRCLCRAEPAPHGERSAPCARPHASHCAAHQRPQRAHGATGRRLWRSEVAAVRSPRVGGARWRKGSHRSCWAGCPEGWELETPPLVPAAANLPVRKRLKMQAGK